MAVNMNRRDMKHLEVIVFFIFMCLFRIATSQNTAVIGQCPCDLTGNACNVNCCCDEDCTDTDKTAFSICLPSSLDTDNRLCFRKGIFQFVNSTPVNSDPFCIYFDNYKERNYYTDPDSINTAITFQEYQDQFFKFSFASTPPSEFDYNSAFYKIGDPIFTVFESQATGELGLPRSLTSSECVDGNRAAYLTDQSYSCVRRLQTPSADWGNLTALNAHSYSSGFKIVTSPQMFQVFNTSVNETASYNLYNNSYTITVQVGSVQCTDTSGIVASCNYTELPLPSSNGTYCKDIVKQVHYRLFTNGTRGIVSVYADFVLTELAISSPVKFTQSFQSTFLAVTTQTPFKRSGNPGYVVGQPVLAGTFNRTVENDPNSEIILVNANRDRYMTLVKASLTGDCITGASADRISVVFGVNMRTGCSLRVSAANITDFCSLMHQAIISAFEFDSIPELSSTQKYVDNNRFVALYGNSDILKTGDWVKIINNRPDPPITAASASSCQLPLAMEIKILFANIGALVNPQAKIIAVAFAYDTPRTVQIRCVGPTCQSDPRNLSQSVEITQSVAFIDMSQPAVGFQGEPPIFFAKVPYDFFYPFITGTALSTPPATLLQCLVLVCLVLLGVRTVL